jgi:multiple sugar transport system permease protein
MPPEWLPRVYVLDLDGEKITTTPPRVVGSRKALVELQEGPKKGQQALLELDQFKDGQAYLSVNDQGRLVEKPFAAALIQDVPADYVTVKEWTLSKYRKKGKLRTFYVEPERVSVEIRPIVGNYPEAARALTADEEAKSLPLGELLSRTRWPWSSDSDKSRIITFLTYLSNTLLVALLAVFGTTMSSALVAYGVSRIEWKGRNVLFGVTLATMMIPFPVLMIPLYSVFRELGWIGTLKPLWVPAFFGSAFNIFLLRQFFMTIPKELSEAARIDGCNEFQIFWQILVPLAKPALAVVALFHFLFVYNDFLGPLLFLTEPDTFTMALGLQQYQSQEGGSEWHLLMAASVLLVLPIIILFFFTQRTFIQGISTTGLKG